VVSDGFTRTVTAGWGTSSSGHAYAYPYGTTRLSADGDEGVATLAPGQVAEATVGGAGVLDATSTVDLAVSALPSSGNGVSAATYVRAGSGRAYRLTTRVAPAGKAVLALERVDGSAGAVTTLATAVAPVTVSASRYLTARLDVSGTSPVSLAGKVWVRGTAEPATLVSAQDSSAQRIGTAGGAGLWAYVSGGSQQTTVRFDNYAVSTAATTPTTPPGTPTTPTTPTTPSTAGSAVVGSTSYPVPAGAVVVSPSGSDSAAGTLSAPVRSVTRAAALARSGSTIVLRGGTYHESVMLPKEKTLTVQSYPGEAAWLDGSSVVTGFTKSGNAWVKSGWTASFDRSPTYARGAPDSTTPAYQWINPAHPYAAWPDQVWVDGTALTQVGSAGAVTAGTFYVDYAADKLYVGTDPTGRTVRASDLVVGMTVLGNGSVVRGIGIRRFAPSVPDMGTLRLFGPNIRVENVQVTDNANGGVTVNASGVTLDRVDSLRNGQVGFHGHRSDNLTATSVRSEYNNRELFNPAPAAAGWKVTSSRTVTVKNSLFANNYASGIWFDESVYNVTVTGGTMVNNTRHGLVFELSAKSTAVNNVISGNLETGLLVLDSSQVSLWNNSVRGGLLPVRIADGTRTASTYADVTGVMKDVELKNNVVGEIRRGDNWCGVACFLDDRRISTAAQMNGRFDGNVYQRPSTSVPTTLLRWAGGSAPQDYKTLAAFRSATRQEASGAEVTSTTSVIRSNGTYTGAAAAGVAVPATVAAALGVASGTKLVGPVR
jgi:parallel beta-helix repeat protein